MSYFPRTSNYAIADNKVIATLDAPLDQLTNIWTALESSADVWSVQNILRDNRESILSNTLSIVQKCAVAAGTVGVMPSNWSTVSALSAMDVRQVALSIVWDAVESSGLIDELKQLVLELAQEVLEDLFDGVEQLVSGIPIIGWVADIIIGFVTIIQGLVKLARQANLSSPPEYCQLPRPYTEADASNANALIRQMTTWDWNSMFSPLALEFTPLYGGPVTDSKQIQGFSCCPTESGANVFELLTQSTSLGAGLIPGTGTIADGPWMHRKIVFYQPGDVGSASTTDTGDWFPQTRAVGGQAWAYLFNGPTMFCADARVIKDRWIRYLTADDGYLRTIKECLKWGKWKHSKKNGWTRDEASNSTKSLRTRMVLERFGITQALLAELNVDQEEIWLSPIIENLAINASSPVRACDELARRQKAFLGRPVVAYVYADMMPATPLREAVKKAQAELVQNPEGLCSLDIASIPDPELRAIVELKRSQAPLKYTCVQTLGGVLPTDAAIENKAWDPYAPDVPPMPDWPDKTPSGSNPLPASVSPGALGRAGAQLEDDSSGALITIGALGLIGVGGYLWYRKRK